MEPDKTLANGIVKIHLSRYHLYMKNGHTISSREFTADDLRVIASEMETSSRNSDNPNFAHAQPQSCA